MGQGHIGNGEAPSFLQTGWRSLRSEPKGVGCEIVHQHPGEINLVPIMLSLLSDPGSARNAGQLERSNADRFWETTEVWLNGRNYFL